jgi:hypothetical protein
MPARADYKSVYRPLRRISHPEAETREQRVHRSQPRSDRRKGRLRPSLARQGVVGHVERESIRQGIPPPPGNTRPSSLVKASMYSGVILSQPQSSVVLEHTRNHFSPAPAAP